MAARSSQNLIGALAALLAFAIILWAPQVLNDGDTWWHVEAGRAMIADRAVMQTDTFSYTFRGQPWPSHEWLADVVFGAGYELAGWGGVLLVTALAAGAGVWIYAREMGRRISGLPFICLLLICLSLIAPHLLIRPHILTLPLLAAWVVELVRARSEDRAPRWAFAPLMILWANMHGGFMLGLALTGVFALEALIEAPAERRAPVALRWGGFGLLSGAMALVTPHGIDGFLFPFKLTGMAVLGGIDEWKPADFSSIEPLQIALLAGLYILLTRPVRLSIFRALLLLGLLHTALTHIRHEQILGLVGGLILAAPLAKAFGQSEESPAAQPRWIFAAVMAGVLCLGAARLAVPVAQTDRLGAPFTALAKVPAEIRAQPVLNDYAFGGFLIGQQVAPYIDSRAEVYRDAFILQYARLAHDPAALAKELRDRKVGWAIVLPGTPLARVMDAQPGWRRYYADRWAVVYIPVAAK